MSFSIKAMCKHGELVHRRKTAEAALKKAREMSRAGCYDIYTDPVDRLHAIHAHTSAAKERHDPVAARALMNWTVAGGPPLVARAARLYSQLRVADVAEPDFHVVVSNIPGPAGPLYCANSAMTALYPTGPLGEGAGLNITLGSYAGQLNFSLITCPEVVPDGARIARDLQDELTALVVATRG